MCELCRLTRRGLLRSFAAAAVAGGVARAAAAAAAETVVLGSGEYRFEVVPGWGELPPGYSYKDATSIAVDSKDNVYVFNRGTHPVIVFDPDGKFLRSWGEDIGFTHAHGAAMGPDDMLYLTDDFGATVRKCTLDGKVVLTIGTPNRPAPRFSGQPFNRCTHTALSPQGEIYVSDGYQNARVHKYSPDGKLLFSWGEPGTDPGQFNLVHNIACDDEGWVYVADRENHRVQVFSPKGKYETEWHGMLRPCGLFVTRGKNPLAVVGELGPETAATLTRDVPNLGPRVSILSVKGEMLAHLGTKPVGEGLGQFIAPHGIAVDSRGDIYVAEVSNTYWPELFGKKPDHELRSMQKLARVA